MPEFLVRFYYDLQSHVMGEVVPSPLRARLADERREPWMTRPGASNTIIAWLSPFCRRNR